MFFNSSQSKISKQKYTLLYFTPSQFSFKYMTFYVCSNYVLDNDLVRYFVLESYYAKKGARKGGSKRFSLCLLFSGNAELYFEYTKRAFETVTVFINCLVVIYTPIVQ